MRRTRPPLVFLGVLIVLLPGCANPQSTSPRFRDDVQLDVSLADAKAIFGTGAPLVVTVSYAAPLTTLAAGVVLPEGVQLVDGSLSLPEGPAPPSPVVLRGIVQAPHAGEWIFRTWVEARGIGGSDPQSSGANPVRLIGVRGNADDATTFLPALPREEPISVALNATSADASAWLLTISTKTDLPLRVDLLAPGGARFADGKATTRVNARGGEPLRLAYSLDYSGLADGRYSLLATAVAHPSVSTRSADSEIFIDVQNHRATLTPREGPPGASSPPSPAASPPG